MGDLILTVKTFDVNGAPLPLESVPRVLVDGGASQPLAPAPGQVATFELKLPAGATKLIVGVEEKGFWSVIQGLVVRPGPTPVLDWDPKQEPNARSLETHKQGSDQNLIVNLVPGHLRDGRAAIEAAGAGMFGGLQPVKNWVRSFGGEGVDVLTNGATGWHRLNWLMANKDDHPPDGRMFYLERQTTPKLLAVYVPKDRFGKDKGPVPYHIFFHPVADFLSRTYPFHHDWADLISRYMLFPSVWNVGKSIVNQCHVSGKRACIVFPVGSPVEWFAGFSKQTSLLRTLQELNFFLQRAHEMPVPVQPLGKVAVSGFSRAAMVIRTMLDSPDPVFDGQHLREVYGFDLFLDDDVPGMCAKLRAWHRGGADGRRLRIYTTNDGWSSRLRDLAPGAVVHRGSTNSSEERTASSTVVLAPHFGFFGEWHREAAPLGPGLDDIDKLPDPGNFKGYHGMFPAIFMNHAMKCSAFADP